MFGEEGAVVGMDVASAASVSRPPKIDARMTRTSWSVVAVGCSAFMTMWALSSSAGAGAKFSANERSSHTFGQGWDQG